MCLNVFSAKFKDLEGLESVFRISRGIIQVAISKAVSTPIDTVSICPISMTFSVLHPFPQWY